MNFPNNINKRRQGQADSGSYVEDAVGAQLRSFYAGIADQKVPQHLLDLLDTLDRTGSQQIMTSVKK